MKSEILNNMIRNGSKLTGHTRKIFVFKYQDRRRV